MSFASRLRNAYDFEQADSLQGLVIDDTVNQAVVESFDHMERGDTVPTSLSWYTGLVVMRNVVGMYITHTNTSEWFRHGFNDAITTSATGLARVALLRQHAELSEALSAIYHEGMPDDAKARAETAMHNATISAAERQVDDEEAVNLYHDWSSQFPLLDRIRNAADQPTPWHGEAEYSAGYSGGLYFWPAAVGAYALGEELREQFGDIL